MRGERAVGVKGGTYVVRNDRLETGDTDSIRPLTGTVVSSRIPLLELESSVGSVTGGTDLIVGDDHSSTHILPSFDSVQN